jgi:hypothetical protein
MVIEITYGGKIWDEMGKDLIHWNTVALEHANEAFSTFWFVDIFHSREYRKDSVYELK